MRFAKSNYLGHNLISYCDAVPHVDNDGVRTARGTVTAQIQMMAPSLGQEEVLD